MSGCDRPAGTAQPAPAGDVHRVKYSREVMGTLAAVTALAADEATARAAVEAAYARLEDVNRLMSDYVADSEIGQLNQLPAGGSLVVSPETCTCLAQALTVAERSRGAFDVTCRPLVSLWKQAGRQQRLPTDADLAEARRRVGWQQVRLDQQTRTVTIAAAGVQVDLGGIAKGYSLDLAAAALRSAGATSGLVDVGGDIVTFGPRADGTKWRIGVRHPFRDGLVMELLLMDAAVATSGVQQRFYEIDGQRYSHIVDPRTGWPAREAPSVTVVATAGATADAWATVFSVLTVTEGQALLAEPDAPEVEVMWITGDRSAPVINKTPGFDRYIAP
jgi:thiamine biosynthesis lipoprotein